MDARQRFVTSDKKAIQEQVLAKIYKPQSRFNIFDIGACEGLNSVRYGRMFPNATVYAFEPVPSNFELINDNIKEYGVSNVRVYDQCFSNQKGISVFHLSSGAPKEIKGNQIDWNFGNKSSSLLPPDRHIDIYPWVKFEEKIMVKTERLENFCAEKNIFEIGFVHMDVQGAEMLVLEGAGPMIYNINSLWLEVEAVPLYKDQPLKSDIEAFFLEKRFKKVVDTVNDIAGDQFWVNSNLIASSAIA